MNRARRELLRQRAQWAEGEKEIFLSALRKSPRSRARQVKFNEEIFESVFLDSNEEIDRWVRLILEVGPSHAERQIKAAWAKIVRLREGRPPGPSDEALVNLVWAAWSKYCTEQKRLNKRLNTSAFGRQFVKKNQKLYPKLTIGAVRGILYRDVLKKINVQILPPRVSEQ